MNYVKKLLATLSAIIIIGMLVQENFIDGQAWFNQAASIDDVHQELENNTYDVDARDENGLTGLMVAAQRGDAERLYLLLQYGADPNAKSLVPDNEGYIENTPLHYAAIFGDNDDSEDIMQLLVNHGADVNARNKNNLPPDFDLHLIKGGDSPIHSLMWVQNGDKRMRLLRYLLLHQADPNAQDNAGNTILHLAAHNNDISFMEMLNAEMRSIADYTIKNKFGQTPYQLAFDSGNGEMAQTLAIFQERLGSRGQVSKRDNQGRTGLMLAIERGDVTSVRDQLQSDADINAQDFKGYTPLMYAVLARKHALDLVRLLLKHEARVNATTIEGATALHFVPKLRPLEDQPEAARLLIEAGADVSVQDIQGNTIMHNAVSEQSLELISYLKPLANSSILNNEELTPLDLARNNEYEDIVEIMEN